VSDITNRINPSLLGELGGSLAALSGNSVTLPNLSSPGRRLLFVKKKITKTKKTKKKHKAIKRKKL